MGRIRLAFTKRYLANGIWQTLITTGDTTERLKFNADVMESIEFGGDDYTFTIDLGKGRVFQHWMVESYPTQEVRNKVLTVMYFAHKAMELDNLREEISCARPTDRQALLGLSELALTLIDSLRPPSGLVSHRHGSLTTLKRMIRDNLGQPISLLNRLPSRMTEPQWFVFRISRLRLVSTLEQAAIWLRHVDILTDLKSGAT